MKTVEETVRRSAERLNLALRAAHLGDWEWFAADDRMVLSPRTRKSTESTRAKLTSARNFALSWKSRIANPRVTPLIAPSKATANTTSNIPILRSDGERRWVAAKGRVVEDSDGNVVGMLGVVQDVTARKAADKEREELLEKIDSERARLS
ncbi:MAG: PAS domain S-box protein, partial [Pirellulales bacterium]